jgi:hypothetical protein
MVAALEQEIGLVPRRRRRLMVIPLILVCLLAAGLGYLFTTAETKPSTQLGAPAEVPGGIALITGIVPVESDGWEPPSPAASLQQPVQQGAHRVRVQVRFTAMDPQGLALDPAAFVVDGLGSGRPHPLWTSPQSRVLKQGESVEATMVFELPDKAVALVLEGPGRGRLSLGKSHHSGS